MADYSYGCYACGQSVQKDLKDDVRALDQAIEREFTWSNVYYASAAEVDFEDGTVRGFSKNGLIFEVIAVQTDGEDVTIVIRYEGEYFKKEAYADSYGSPEFYRASLSKATGRKKTITVWE